MKNAVLVFILIVLAGAGVWWYASSHAVPAGQQDSSQNAGGSASATQGQDAAGGTSGDTSGSGAELSTLTMAQVAQHTNASSCWTVIDGNVYDLTKWIPQHPGGEQAILSLCGKDGSDAFHNQHDHAQRQENILATFLLGPVVTQ